MSEASHLPSNGVIAALYLLKGEKAQSPIHSETADRAIREIEQLSRERDEAKAEASTWLDHSERAERERDDYCRQLTAGIREMRRVCLERERLMRELAKRPARDAEHCDYPDCEQHNSLVVERLRAALESIRGMRLDTQCGIDPLRAAGMRDALDITREIAEKALSGEPNSAPETTAPQAPIAKVIVREDCPAEVMLYAPGLPPGEHDLYCEPEAVAPMMRNEMGERRYSETQVLHLLGYLTGAIEELHQFPCGEMIPILERWNLAQSSEKAKEGQS